MLANKLEWMVVSGMKLEERGQVEKNIILIGLMLSVRSCFLIKRGRNQPSSQATCLPADVKEPVLMMTWSIAKEGLLRFRRDKHQEIFFPHNFK